MDYKIGDKIKFKEGVFSSKKIYTRTIKDIHITNGFASYEVIVEGEAWLVDERNIISEDYQWVLQWKKIKLK